jgi:UDP-glucose 4-epimerase
MAFNTFIAKIARGEEITVHGDGEQTRDFTFVADAVAGTILASRAAPGSVYNVGGGKTASLNEVISLIETTIGKKAKVNRDAKAAGDVRSTSADISRIRGDLGYVPKITLSEGLRKQIGSQLR